VVRARSSAITPPQPYGSSSNPFLWREQRLVVETDSHLYHRGSISFEDDHVRDLDLRGMGCTVLRFTDRQIEDEPERITILLANAVGVAPLPGL
jgi:very-short-patch-repair endonuclease